MKNKLIIITVVFLTLTVNAQTNEQNDIKNVVNGYIENFFENKYPEMEVNLHEQLSKRGVNQDGTLNPNVSKEDLKKIMEKQRAFPKKYQKNIISDIKINNRVATAVLKTGYPKARWTEYIHLAKFNGKWVIMDVFWCFENIKD